MVENNVKISKFEKKHAVTKFAFLCVAKRFMMICLLHWVTMPMHTVAIVLRCQLQIWLL